jgi:hypothetical protein
MMMHVWPLKYTIHIRRLTGFAYFSLVPIRHTVPTVCCIEQKQRLRNVSFIVKYVGYHIIEGGYFKTQGVFISIVKVSVTTGLDPDPRGQNGSQKGMMCKVSHGSSSWGPEAYEYFYLK